MLELHLTLTASSAAEAELWRWAELHDCNVTCIELDQGDCQRQVMLTTRILGDVAIGMQASRRLTSALKALSGVEVKRTKLETPLGLETTAGLYLEHHVKVRLSADAVPALAELGRRHAAHLSRNAFRQFAAHEERFLTQRFATNQAGAAEQGLTALIRELAERNFDVIKVERELVLVDNNLALDDGWATEKSEMIWPFSKTKKALSPPYHPLGYSLAASGADVFDPAVKQHGSAFVKGEPSFADASQELTYQAARRQAFEHCLNALASSPLGEQVVLRGSVTLELWFGERARRAKDIDLVVRDSTLAPDSKAAEALLTKLRESFCAELARRNVDVLEQEVTVDSIWTYERAEGRRLVFPWIWQQELRSQIQVDVVFQEPLQEAPEAQSFGSGQLWFASRAESLAWKLLWLSSDRYPQGKDLYDAVLLAESTALSAELVGDVFAAKHTPLRGLLGTDARGAVAEWEVDWENFAKDYPALALGPVEGYKERLLAALSVSANTK